MHFQWLIFSINTAHLLLIVKISYTDELNHFKDTTVSVFNGYATILS